MPIRRLLLLLACALAARCLTVAPALAQPADSSLEPPPDPVPSPRVAPFGSRGQWVVSGGSSVFVSTQSFDSSSAVFSSANFQPLVDWFVARNVSLGLVTHVAYSDSKGYGADNSLVDTRTATVRVAPRVGLNVPLGERVSLWPTAELGFEWVHEDQSVVSGTSSSVSGNPLGYPSSTNLGPWGEVDVALLWHLRPHFFLGVSGGVFHDFSSVQGGPDVGGQQTEVSGGFLLGGWFGGSNPHDASAEEFEQAAASSESRRFGQAGQVALSSELELSADWGQYAGTSSSYSGAGIAAGADYFVADHVSLGGAVSAAYGSTSGVDPTNSAQVTSSSTSASVLARLGVDIPVGKTFSLWPRVSLGASTRTIHQNEGAQAATEEDDKPVFIGLYAPLLVHVAPHVFVGFGPSVAHDLSHPVVVFNPNVSTTGPASQNVSTTVGASLLVGGWL